MLNYLAMGIIGLTLLVSLYSDIRYRKIYNVVTIPVFIMGFFVSGFMYWYREGWKGVVLWLTALVIAGLCGWIFERGAIWAAGDTKLYLSCLTWLYVVYHSVIVTGLIIGAILMLHFLLNIVARLMKYTFRIPRLFRLIPNGQYPGAITITLAVLLVVVI